MSPAAAAHQENTKIFRQRVMALRENDQENRIDWHNDLMPTHPIQESTVFGTRSKIRPWRISVNPAISPYGFTTTSKPSVRTYSLPMPSGATLMPRISAKKSSLTSSERTTLKLEKRLSRSLGIRRTFLYRRSSLEEARGGRGSFAEGLRIVFPYGELPQPT